MTSHFLVERRRVLGTVISQKVAQMLQLVGIAQGPFFAGRPGLVAKVLHVHTLEH
jgi:hypothetical protein